jgi:hypothetical protein
MAYGFSVFWLPLSRAIGVVRPDPADWKIATLGWIYTLFFVFLGSSARCSAPGWSAVRARRAWSRRSAGVADSLSALGIYLHQIWLLWLGSGVIGGCGLGLGCISPVSALIKWFPDRRQDGHRACDHGIRRRRVDRDAARRCTHAPFRHAGVSGRVADVRVLRRDLFRGDDRRGELPASACRMVAARLWTPSLSRW